MTYLGILFLLSFLILLHEVGHLVAAKLVGIPIADFSVGLGPKLWTRRWKGTDYSLRALPLGGFVLPAMAEESEFRRIALWRRILFFLGGPAANLATALPLLAVLNGTRQGLSFYNVFVAPWGQLAALCWNTLGVLPKMFAQPESLSGVIGIVAVGGRISDGGMVLQFAILLSVSLAVLNLLPIPILDGGQIVMSTLEHLFPRMVRLRGPLTLLGMIVLGFVMIYANVQDVVRIWG
ncbi:MAG TPA: site-2 protease family protein [Thermoanaerobaculia bacterium]|nr:site-2 protease family protein [Thermoanaerobaculia bacterium]